MAHRRKMFSAAAIAVLALVSGCGKAGGGATPSVETSGPLTVLQANVIARVTCGGEPRALDLDVKKRRLADFVELQPMDRLAKGNCMLKFKPVDFRIQTAVVVKPGNSSEPNDWTVDSSNPTETGIGIGKDDVAYVLIHAVNLGKVKVPYGEDIKLGPNLTTAQQAKNVAKSVLYSHVVNTWG